MSCKKISRDWLPNCCLAGLRVHANSENSFYPFENTLWGFGGNMRYHFGRSKIKPYGLFGGTLLRHSEISDAPSFPGIFQATRSSFGLKFGGGVRVSQDKFVFRPQFTILYDTSSYEHSERHTYYSNISALLGYSW